MKKSRIGEILILIVLLFCISSHGAIFFGGSAFALVLIICWLTISPEKLKVSWRLISIFIWCLILVSLFKIVVVTVLSQKKYYVSPQKRDFIISEDFKGRIIVVESKCGETPISKEGRMQFEIPSNGIYLYNGELTQGSLYQKNYLQKKSGELIELEYKYSATKNDEKDTTGIERITGIYGYRYKAFDDRKSNYIVKYVETNKFILDKEQLKLNKEQDGIVDSLRADCKNKN